MRNIIVIGASGQLGQCLKYVANKRSIEKVNFLTTSEASVVNLDSLSKAFSIYRPDFVVNCAAYTAVDKAEDEPDAARAINKTGAENLAILCAENNVTLIHISTDFVFKGETPHPLSENDPTKPVSVYGLTKLEGERAITAKLPQHYILRTSWLYSEYANNFVKTMLKLGAERDVLKIIADQTGTPTYAIDLAGVIFDIIDSATDNYGIYHYSNEGVASWYDFARAVFDLSGTYVNTFPISTGEYPTKATRPAYSVMDKTKLKTTFGMQIPYWRDSLAICIAAIKNQAINQTT